MRARGLRFTWALLAVPAAAFWARLDHDVAAVCGAAVLGAVGFGVRWHCNDVQAGGDPAQRAEAAFGPVDAVRAWWARRAARAGQALSARGLLVGVGDR